jgi:hypothetical protein
MFSDDCRLMAETKLALAEQGGDVREVMVFDAAALVLLAHHLDYITAVSVVPRKRT